MIIVITITNVCPLSQLAKKTKYSCSSLLKDFYNANETFTSLTKGNIFEALCSDLLN